MGEPSPCHCPAKNLSTTSPPPQRAPPHTPYHQCPLQFIVGMPASHCSISGTHLPVHVSRGPGCILRVLGWSPEPPHEQAMDLDEATSPSASCRARHLSVLGGNMGRTCLLAKAYDSENSSLASILSLLQVSYRNVKARRCLGHDGRKAHN